MMNENLPQGLTDEEVVAVCNRIVERMAKYRYRTGVRTPTAKQLLAHAMSALVEHQKGTLVLMKAIRVLAQQAVKEKKAAESAGEKWE